MRCAAQETARAAGMEFDVVHGLSRHDLRAAMKTGIV
jgi:hypothetical protein